MRLIRTLLCALLLVSPSIVLAQSSTGTITGAVKDSSGAVIPRATVTITNQQTDRQERSRRTSRAATRRCRCRRASTGSKPALQGFRRAARAERHVQVNATVVVDFTLEVGDLTDAVEVRADATLLETTSGTVGKVVDNRRILELPLNTRNVYSLIFLTPGVGRLDRQQLQLDELHRQRRAADDDGYRHRRRDGVVSDRQRLHRHLGVPSVDAIQEFKVLGANYPAEYGRSLGSVLNVVYKSGTNQFHGSAYEFFRDSALDANNYFAKRAGQPLGDFQRSQFGGVAGGPIRRGRTFFMTSFEGLREQRAVADHDDGADAGAASGRFLADPGAERPADSHLRPVLDPRRIRRAAGSSAISSPTTSSRSNRMDPVARQVLQVLPAAEPAGQPGDRRAELLRHRHRRAERRQHRRPRRSPALRQGRRGSSATPTARRSARRRRSSRRTSRSRKGASTSRTARTTRSSTTTGRSRTRRC